MEGLPLLTLLGHRGPMVSGVWSGTLRPMMAPRMAAVLSETTMRCLRIYATPDGESHFDEIDIPTTKRPVFPDSAPFELSADYPASSICTALWSTRRAME